MKTLAYLPKMHEEEVDDALHERIDRTVLSYK